MTWSRGLHGQYEVDGSAVPCHVTMQQQQQQSRPLSAKIKTPHAHAAHH